MKDLYQTILDEAHQNKIEIPNALLTILAKHLQQTEVPHSDMHKAIGASVVNIACALSGSSMVVFAYRPHNGNYYCSVKDGRAKVAIQKFRTYGPLTFEEEIQRTFSLSVDDQVWFPFEYYHDQSLLGSIRNV